MPEKSQKRQILKKKLFTKNRLVILNEDTFEEIFSLRLTLMNVFVVASIGAILIITFTTYIIAFTPLREYIPGYASTTWCKVFRTIGGYSMGLTTTNKVTTDYWGIWNQTTAINRIQIAANGDTFKIGSQLRIYGRT